LATRVLAGLRANSGADVPIMIVGIAAVLIGATAKLMGETVRWIETASYLLIYGARRAVAFNQSEGSSHIAP
jgi:hypothetical protein